MGGLLYPGKLDPKNISLNLPQTLPDLHGRTHKHTHTQSSLRTHTHRHTLSLSLWLCCVMLWEAEVAFVGWAEYLCPLWQGLTVPAAACCLSPGHGLPAGPPTNLPEPLPSSWRHPGWSRFMRLWQGPARIAPSHLPSSLAPSAAANNLAVFPMWSSTENQSMLQVIFLSYGRMWMYCIFEGFWRSEKWKKNVCRQGRLYLACRWVSVYIFACFFRVKVLLMVHTGWREAKMTSCFSYINV